MNDDVDLLLQEAGERWRAEQPGPAEPDWSAIPARPGRRWWLAATAAAVVIAVVIVVAVNPLPADKHAPATHQPAPTAQLLVPYATGAVVPAPFVRMIGRPAQISYCAADALTGTFAFHRTAGQLTGDLRLRLKTSATSCSLPGMLADGSNALRFVDRSGTVRGRGLDPRPEFPTNVPEFVPVLLRPGQTATMYVRPKTEPSCPAPGLRAQLRSGQGTLTLPVTGLGACRAGSGVTAYWYGPFSTPGHPVAFQPGSWSDLFATLDFPATTPRGQSTTFHVTLANHGTEAVVLAPCPSFGIVLDGAHATTVTGGSINCPPTPRIIQPGKSSRLTMTVDGALSPGRYSVRWAIAGVGTATADTAVR
jgi:hypothetical protein